MPKDQVVIENLLSNMITSHPAQLEVEMKAPNEILIT